MYNRVDGRVCIPFNYNVAQIGKQIQQKVVFKDSR